MVDEVPILAGWTSKGIAHEWGGHATNSFCIITMPSRATLSFFAATVFGRSACSERSFTGVLGFGRKQEQGYLLDRKTGIREYWFICVSSAWVVWPERTSQGGESVVYSSLIGNEKILLQFCVSICIGFGLCCTEGLFGARIVIRHGRRAS
jgi:hypothetical protein